MTICIKRTRVTSGGDLADGQTTLNETHLDIGASNEQQIQLDWPGVRLRHASLEYQNNQVQLLVHTEQGVLVNGKTVSQAMLSNGDQFQIGNHHFTIEVSEQTLTLELRVDETTTAPQAAEFKTRLADTGFSKRRWSWLLLLSIAIVFLAAPLLQRYALETPSANPILPSHALWNSGDFHPAHQFFADDCSQCHQQPFSQVKNSACMDCHENVAAHAPPETFAIDELQNAECQSCHKEHNGRNELVTADKQLCLGCHQDIQGFTSQQSEQPNIEDWRHKHPEITLQLAQWDHNSGIWQWLQTSATEPAEENSGLIFPHDIHLDAEGLSIENGDIKVMQCQDCHQAEPGGKGMQAIEMETHCDSCHRLDFDADNPDLFVRHGDVAATLRDIAGLKGLTSIKEQLSGDSKKANKEPALKRPGKDKQQRQQTLTLVDLASELIEKRGCVTCHGASRNDSAIAAGDLVNGWFIDPVHINDRWIAAAEFDHAGHQSMDCLTCHEQASDSENASDIMIPSRENCLGCHGNPGDASLIDSQCIDCHSYHLPQHGWLDSGSSAP